MSALDSVADKLRSKSEELAGRGGIKDKLADELAEDAEFLRKLKPELIRRRAKGDAPTDSEPGGPRNGPSGPQLEARPASEETAVSPASASASATAKPAAPRKPSGGGSGGGPNPFVVIGIALVAGVVLAKWLDWRGHAHPRW
ncbi:MAG TPA: hypothetical protein VFL60_02360 [Gaiellaceae bacterium]|nr:hypothetical protein [Gaiellaceae bacterium]